MIRTDSRYNRFADIAGHEIEMEQRRRVWGDQFGPWCSVALPATRAERNALKRAGWYYDASLRGWVKQLRRPDR